MRWIASKDGERSPQFRFTRNASLQRSSANLFITDLRGADLRGSQDPVASLRAADVRNAHLETFNGPLDALPHINPEKVDGQIIAQEDPSASPTIVLPTNLQDSDLVLAYFGGANLTDANLEKANLDSAILTNATLANTNLERANLTLADLEGTDLSSANDAVLVGAN